ncbi:HVO_A0114 family putative DNA-binding protein [Hafnia psychrotolerans]|uniref:Transcriptional regulator n=1 Tax=Hafnia psychrotolerans TaxID=1477018 RepID=A0ABQ1G8I3_9GAMM|nr:MarR family transcriptional regulator [Hafnia psychrotolerans]GGA38667.1 hypothetical protein GCM10011328_11930 [Hafnia psychrotolerans]
MKALIGIMPESMFRERLMAIARGQYLPAEGEPKVWFSSLVALGQILNNDNIALLCQMDSEKPESISELARMSGREVSNLSSTLTTLEKYGFIRKVKVKNSVKPIALFTEFEIRTERFPAKEQQAAA